MLSCLAISVALGSCGFLEDNAVVASTAVEATAAETALDIEEKKRAAKIRQALNPSESGSALATAQALDTVPANDMLVQVSTSPSMSGAIFTPSSEAVVDQTIAAASPTNSTTTSSTPKTTVPATTTTAGASSNWIEIRSATGRTENNVPLQFGRPFKPGEIKNCPQIQIAGTAVASQATVKNRHPDGSVRFAIISYIAQNVSSTAPQRLQLVEGSGCTPVAVNANSLLALDGGFDATISSDASTASARTMLASGSYKVWSAGAVSTTLVLSDHLSKKYDIGSNASKLLRPSFEVQFWPSINKYRVRYIGETSDSEKIGNDTYSLSLKIGSAALPVYSKASFSHTHSSRWTKVFWSGNTPAAELNVNWNLSYLASNQFLPNYDSSINLAGDAEAQIIANWRASARDIQDQGLWNKYMPATGGRPDIGPFPKWMIAWLYSGSAALKEVALGQADLAGAWPVHVREGSATKRMTRAQTGMLGQGLPVSFYARPTLARPGCNGYQFNSTRADDKVTLVGTPDDQGWYPDTAHLPQPYFIPYLLTGEHFYLEQMQFWGTFAAQVCGAFGTNYTALEQTGQCWARSALYNYAGRDIQIRGQAWSLRSIAEAAWVTPNTSDEPAQQAIAADLTSVVEDKVVQEEGLRGIIRGNNSLRVDWKWSNSPSGDCNNSIRSSFATLRIWDQVSGYAGTALYSKAEAGWQLGFLMYSLTRAMELGFPTANLRQWFAPYFIGQVTQPGANPYHLADYLTPTVGINGAVFQTWAAVDAAQGPNYDGAKMWATDGSVRALDQGFGSVALLALASTYGQPDSQTAWSSFALGQYQAWGWQADPKWAVLPR